MVFFFFLFLCFFITTSQRRPIGRAAPTLLTAIMRGTETLSRPLDFFFQGASAPCEKKIEGAEAVGRAAAAPVTTYHARDRNALPMARFFFPHKVRQHLVRKKKSRQRRPIGRAAPTLLTAISVGRAFRSHV